MKALSEIKNPEQPGYKPTYAPIYKQPEGFNLSDLSAFTKGQPYSYFQKLREVAPVSWWEQESITGYWSLTKYEDVQKCDLNAQQFSSQKGGIIMAHPSEGPKKLRWAALDSMINLDQPYHIPLRMEHRPFFTPDFVKQLSFKVEKEVDRLLDNLEAAAKKGDGRCNLVEHFSQWLPLFTVCEILGIDKKDRPAIIRWMHYLELAAYIIADPDNKVNKLFFLKFLWNIRQMFNYGEKVLLNRRKNPRDDLLTVIANAQLDGEPMQESYLHGSWLLIIFAGNDTTRNSLSGTMKLLTEFPEQKQMLLDDPVLVDKMVPEALRLISPVMYMRRTALEDAEFSGQGIGKGEKLVMWYGAANRDPDVFHNPDTMDIHRNNTDKHLAFGTGPHVCLGQRIANMQLGIAYRKILERFPNIRWTGKASYAPSNFVHAISEVEVELN